MALHFSDAEFESRFDRLKAVMEAEKLDVMLLFAQESMYWLTGYDTFGFCFFQCLVVTRDGRKVLLTRSADERQAKHTSNIEDIRIWVDRGAASPVGQLKELLFDMDLLGSRIGIEYDTHGMTGRIALRLNEELTSFADISDASALVPELRAVKSAEEIVYVRKAAELADKAYHAALDEIRPGADEGRIRVRDGDGWVDVATAPPRHILRLRRDVIGYVSQFLRVIPRVATLDIVAAAAEGSIADPEAEARRLLRHLAIPERLFGLPPATFSGGEQQRVNIARGFIANRPLMLLDEPTASLDRRNRDAVIELIQEKRRARAAILAIFHDSDVRARLCDKLVDVTRFAATETALS